MLRVVPIHFHGIHDRIFQARKLTYLSEQELVDGDMGLGSGSSMEVEHDR